MTYAHAITVPMLAAQERGDIMTRPEDVQAIYDAIPAEDKKMVWIEGSTRRFDGYNYFSDHPQVAVKWFDDRVHYMGLEARHFTDAALAAWTRSSRPAPRL